MNPHFHLIARLSPGNSRVKISLRSKGTKEVMSSLYVVYRQEESCGLKPEVTRSGGFRWNETQTRSLVMTMWYFTTSHKTGAPGDPVFVFKATDQASVLLFRLQGRRLRQNGRRRPGSARLHLCVGGFRGSIRWVEAEWMFSVRVGRPGYLMASKNIWISCYYISYLREGIFDRVKYIDTGKLITQSINLNVSSILKFFTLQAWEKSDERTTINSLLYTEKGENNV